MGSSSPSQFATTSSSHNDKVPCPFKIFDGCISGVGGRGYARSAILRHIKDRHFPTAIAKDICRERIRNNLDCFDVWERTLSDLQSWLCINCLHTYAWKNPCRNHLTGFVIAGLFNGSGADFLIDDTMRPQSTLHVNSANNVSASTGVDEDVGGLNVEMLNMVFQKQITTVVSIPSQCRLRFSRT